MKKEETLSKIQHKDNKRFLKTKIISSCNIILISQKKKKVMKIIIQKNKIKIVRFQNNNHNR